MEFSRRAVLRTAAAAAAAAAVDVTGTSGGRPARVNWDAFRRDFSGTLVLPSDAGYQQAKEVEFTQFDSVNPSAIAYCGSVRDIRSCLRFAQDNEILVTLRSGGHSPAGYSTSDGFVVDLSRINELEIGSDTVRIGAGIQQVDALDALSARGLALDSGLCPTVAAAGFVQGGGFGWLTRKHGMSCDSLVSADVVLADGRLVHCSEEEEPDLFWALRGGGGGNFGVVTRFEMTPIRISRLVNWALTWTWDHAAEVLTAWQEWIINAPLELGSSMNFTLEDAAPGAVPTVNVFGAWQGDPESLDRVLDSLAPLVGAPPATKKVSDLSFRDAMMQKYGCEDKTVGQCHRVGTSVIASVPRLPFMPVRGRMFSKRLPANGLDEIMTAFGQDRVAGHTRELSAIGFGGAANRVPRTATAYVHRDTLFTLTFTDALPTGTPSEEDQASALDWEAKGMAAMEPYSNKESYQNFTDPYLEDWRSSYYAENYSRLAEIKRKYDPHRFFRFPQAID